MRRLALACFVVLALQARANATIEVFMDFSEEWQTNILTTTASGVTAFSEGEITTIQTNIASQLNTIFSGLAVNFNTDGNAFFNSRIDFGATGDPGHGSNLFDVHNAFDDEVANVLVNNFGNILDEFANQGDNLRSTQITQISTALANTAAHELGHTLGLTHHHAYHDPAIVYGDSYADTGGVQNTHIMSTGVTGVNESESETPQHFSDFSKILLETTGGLSVIGVSGSSAVATPIPIQDLRVGDVGNAFLTAAALTMTNSSVTNQHRVGFAISTLSDSTDIDFFSFTTTAPNELITIQVWSNDVDVWTNVFDPSITLYGADDTIIATSGVTMYFLDVYDSGATRSSDSFLLNKRVTTVGTYFFSVSTDSDSGDPGGNYTVVTAANNPEPASILMMLTAAAGAGVQTWRRKKKKKAAADVEADPVSV